MCTFMQAKEFWHTSVQMDKRGEANSRILKYRHETGFSSPDLLQFFVCLFWLVFVVCDGGVCLLVCLLFLLE